MASQVLSGSSNVSYTNNTGQNVRIVINYMAGATATIPSTGQTYGAITMSWAGVSAGGAIAAIGRNLAFNNYEGAGITANNALGNAFYNPANIYDGALPTELMLSPGQTFSASCGAYNIVVIPEAG